MDNALLMTAALTDGRALVAAAETDWQRPVPHCPDWDATELVRHMGAILQWMATIVASGDRTSRRGLDPGPEDPADLSSWYLSCLQQTVDLLAAAEPESPTWTFSSLGDHRAAWWARRLAVEIAIHRWDAEHALYCAGGPKPAPLKAAVAQVGVEEFLTEFLPGLRSGDSGDRLAGTLHLQASDVPAEWWINLDTGAVVGPRTAADAELRGTLSQLLLWLTNRLTAAEFDVVRGSEMLDDWKQLKR